VKAVDNRTEVCEFLATRRAKISPEQAGVPLYSGRRRVPGLRREEVAHLAGVSTDYYTRLEKPSMQRILDSMTTAPAFIRNGRLDVLAVNPLGRALYAPVFDEPVRTLNLARFCFLDRRADDFYPDWYSAAKTTVAVLRTEAGRAPYDRELTDLVGELATRSDAFRIRWAAHDVRLHRTGAKHFRHPVVGELDLAFDAMELPADAGLTLTAYTAEPGSAAAEKLTLLASWAAPLPEPGSTSAPDRPGR